MNPNQQEFWDWFVLNNGLFVGEQIGQAAIAELDSEFSKAFPELTWEIGPIEKGNYLAISPGMNPALIEIAKTASSLAPNVSGWRVLSARPKKNWDGKFFMQIGKSRRSFDTATWRFVMLQYKDGFRELIFVSDEASKLLEAECITAAKIAAESVFGEERALALFDQISLEETVDSSLAERMQPFGQLSGAAGGLE
jgi:hypothetical protein